MKCQKRAVLLTFFLPALSFKDISASKAVGVIFNTVADILQKGEQEDLLEKEIILTLCASDTSPIPVHLGNFKAVSTVCYDSLSRTGRHT
ncbi:MAG: hypothetical protein V7750_16025 [Sneathiella sp.]